MWINYLLIISLILLIGTTADKRSPIGNRYDKKKMLINNYDDDRDLEGTLSEYDKDTPGFEFDDREMAKLKLWEGGLIPYYIDKESYDKVFRDNIRMFLESINSLSSLQFMELHRPPTDSAARWVMFVNRRGALTTDDYLPQYFTNEGVQLIVLGYNCLSNGDLFRVVLSIAGVPPQHNAPNRDEYIEVKKDNIQPGKHQLFKIYKDNEWLFHDLDVKYDFYSAGHFGSHKYTQNGFATIVPKDDDFKLSNNERFSATDIVKLRLLYNYIASKKQMPVRVEDCKKIFVPKTNFKNFNPNKNEITPRKKPNKYLGLREGAEVETKSFDDKDQVGSEESKLENKKANSTSE